MLHHDPPKSTSNRMLNVEELAGILCISRRTIWRMVASGELPQPIRFGRCVRWRYGDIEDWLEQLANQAALRNGRRQRLR